MDLKHCSLLELSLEKVSGYQRGKKERFYLGLGAEEGEDFCRQS